MRPHLYDGFGPLILAHRGGGAEVPENSLDAVAHAARLGVVMETDVRLTSDGVVVLFHDDDLARTTTGSGPLEAHTWEELTRVRDASGRHPVRLEEALELDPDLRLNIDAKTDEVTDPLIAALRAGRALDRVALSTFSDARIGRIRAALPGVPTTLSSAEVAAVRAASLLPRRAADAILSHLPLAGEAVVGAFVPERWRGIPIVTPRFLATAHRHQLIVAVWTVNERSDMNRLLDAGVDGLVTDRPTLAIEVAERRGTWH